MIITWIFRRTFPFLCLLYGLAHAVHAAPPGPQEIAFFEQKIRPVLVRECYACHSQEAQAAKKLKGGLFLDSGEGVLAGGESGAAIVKGKSAESLLIKALKYEGH